MKPKLNILFSILVLIYFLISHEIYAQKKVFIEAHIVYSSSLGINGINPNDVITSINQILTIYTSNNTGITFELGSTDYLDNPNFVNVVRGNGEEHSQQAADLFNLYTKPGVIHVVFVPTLDQQGVAYGIPSRIIIMANGSALNNETLAHEMGHCLGLHHTYRGNENVTRNTNSPYYNATTQGDFLHDTPADPVNDPNKFGPFIYNCQFTNPSNTHSPPPENALYVDPQNVLVKNIMSLPKFSLNCSRYNFTAGQIGRMNDYLNETGPLADLLNNVKTSVTNKFGEANITNSTLTINSRSYSSGDFAYLKQTNTHIGKTNHERFYNFQSNNIKHHDWNSDYLQYHQTKDFNVSAQNNFRYTYFLPINPITAINSKAESSVFFNADIEFKDPWYLFSGNIQQSDQNYAWVPNSNPNWLKGAFDQTSGGVFLDQEYIPSQPNKPYYSIRVPQYQDKFLTQTGKTHRFYLNDWTSSGPVNVVSPNLNESPVVFSGSGSTITANLKGTQLSNDQTAYANNSQRKFVRTPDGYYHHVYESMGRVWYEISSDGGSNWQLMNGGKPLDNGEAKLPSLDYSSFFDLNAGTIYQIAIVFQENNSNRIRLQYFYRDEGFDYTLFDDEVVQNLGGSYLTHNANPVIGFDHGNNITIVWQHTSSGLYARHGVINYIYGITLYGSIGNHLTGTTLSSVTPTIYVSKSGTASTHLAWAQIVSSTQTDIKYAQMSWSNITGNIVTASLGSGFIKNYKPSIIEAGSGARVCWIGERQQGHELPPLEAIQKNVVFTDPDNTGRFWTFGSNVNSVSINKCNDRYTIAWASSDDDKIKYTDSKTLRTVYTLNIKGKDVQLSSGSDSTTMHALAFNTQNLPYYMPTQRLYLSQPPIRFDERREGGVSEEMAQVYFNIGDVVVDNEAVGFVEIPDTTSINSL